MVVCEKCLKESTTELISTDHFRGEEIKQYCEDCFFEGLQTAFNDPDLVCNCGVKMVLEVNDKEEIVDIVRENEVIFYACEEIVKARLDMDNNIIEELEQNHDLVGFYITQPEADYE
ncbi:hypothetical protein [Solibacillus sp. FSL W8-0372]|uniref:hypothetical protein n=1 Tax=Solibacillus sp. FSL W8-0372 TaxID=2921713 RepID=UPI0030D04524